jgi:hypothetical protein
MNTDIPRTPYALKSIGGMTGTFGMQFLEHLVVHPCASVCIRVHLWFQSRSHFIQSSFVSGGGR